MALIAQFTTVNPNMAQTRTAEDFCKMIGMNPKRLGMVASMYKNLTASYLTEGLGNIVYNKQKGSKFQKINSLAFDWSVDVNFIKRVPIISIDGGETVGQGGSFVTMYFGERYYEKFETFQIISTKQQCIVLQAPRRKADNYWEYVVQLIDNTGEDSLDTKSLTGAETRFLTNINPEFSDQGYTKFQSNVENHRNWISEIRSDVSWSSRYALMEDTFIKISNGEEGGLYKEKIYRLPKVKQVCLEDFMTKRNNNLLLGKSTMDPKTGKCTVHDPDTNRPLISGDGALPQIHRFATMFSYSKLTIAVFNKAIMTLNQKADEPQGNTYVVIANERAYADIQVVLAQYLMQFRPVDANVYSEVEGKKISIGAEYSGYNFMGNSLIFKVDRALTYEYPDKGYAVFIDLTADKTSGQSAISMFTLENGEFIENTIAGVGGLDGGTSGAVASPVAGSKQVITGYAGIGVFAPYRSFVMMEA